MSLKVGPATGGAVGPCILYEFSPLQCSDSCETGNVVYKLGIVSPCCSSSSSCFGCKNPWVLRVESVGQWLFVFMRTQRNVDIFFIVVLSLVVIASLVLFSQLFQTHVVIDSQARISTQNTDILPFSVCLWCE